MSRTTRLNLTTRSALAASGAALGLLLAACGGGSGYGSASSGSTAPPVRPSGNLLASASTSLGTILVDGKGKTVYSFAADKDGRSVCDAACIAYWPPVPAPATLPASLPGVTARLGTTTRDDGTKQLTVGGHPVYTYVGDTSPGSAAGQGTNISGGLWWVLSPAGAVDKAKRGSGSSSSSSDMGYGTGY